jgi:hypothetical protein
LPIYFIIVKKEKKKGNLGTDVYAILNSTNSLCLLITCAWLRHIEMCWRMGAHRIVASIRWMTLRVVASIRRMTLRVIAGIRRIALRIIIIGWYWGYRTHWKIVVVIIMWH